MIRFLSVGSVRVVWLPGEDPKKKREFPDGIELQQQPLLIL